jgi:hypothetical protein
LSVDLFPVLLQVCLVYRSPHIQAENQDIPFLVSCRMLTPASLVHLLCDYFFEDYTPSTGALEGRLWGTRRGRRPSLGAGTDRGDQASPPDSMAGGAGVRARTGRRMPRDGERWTLLDAEKHAQSLETLGLAHDDRIMLEVRDKSGESESRGLSELLPPGCLLTYLERSEGGA